MLPTSSNWSVIHAIDICDYDLSTIFPGILFTLYCFTTN